VPYLTQVKNFTEQQVVSDIFPVFTYSTFAFTLVAAPASLARHAATPPPRALTRAQLLGCKRVVVLGAACRLSTRLLLLWGRSLAAMQVMQVAFGAGVAAEVVFNGFVFTLVARPSPPRRAQPDARRGPRPTSSSPPPYPRPRWWATCWPRRRASWRWPPAPRSPRSSTPAC